MLLLGLIVTLLQHSRKRIGMEITCHVLFYLVSFDMITEFNLTGLPIYHTDLHVYSETMIWNSSQIMTTLSIMIYQWF